MGMERMKPVSLLRRRSSHIFASKPEPYPSLARACHTTHLDLNPTSLSVNPIKSPPISPRFSESTAPTHQNSSNSLLSLLHSCTDILALGKIHGLLVVRGLTQNLQLQTKLFESYGTLGNVERARTVFDRIPDPDLYSWKVMLKWYIKNERYMEAIAFYNYMRQCLQEHDNIIFSLVLKACAKLFDLDEGKKLHCHITKVGNPDCFVLNVLIDMYAKCGDMECARRLFDEIREKNVVSWTSIIAGYVQNDGGEKGLVLFNKMRWACVQPNEHTIGSLLTACSVLDALHQGKWIHGYVIKDGMGISSFLGTPLLNMYVKCGQVTDARSIFDELCNVDTVSWTAMIVGYTQKGHPAEALKLFSDEKWTGIVPNSVTIASALSASAQLKILDLGRSLHMLGIKLGLEEYTAVMNALVDMYAKCCAIFEANYIFERTTPKDVVSWNAMIAGYSQNDLGYEALLLFNQMRSDGCSPDAITVVSALSACACLGALSIGSCFHVYAVKCAFLSNIYVCTALLNFYNKCGDAVSARKVFDEMRDRNTVTWCAMMGGYGMQGDSIGSVDLLNKMLKEDLQPNDVTFTSILTACSHTGMVEEGCKYFDTMSQNYNIVPSMKHYACMVDMLARAGKFEEALEFIERMPMQADVRVWGAFLHGCRLHSRLEFGEVAVKKMIELQPETPDYYVLMCNLYASDGKWDEAFKIREVMKEKGLIKLPGCSSMGMDNGLPSVALKDMFHKHGNASPNFKGSFEQLAR